MAKPAPTLFPERPPSAASRGNSGSDSPSVQVIRSLKAADLALAELADLDADERKIQAECDHHLGLVREKFAARYHVTIDGKKIPFADRRSDLVAALREFAEQCGSQVFDMGKRSKALNHGEFGFRKSNAKLEDIGSAPPKTFKTALESIAEKIRAALDKLQFLFARGSGFLKVKLELDRQKLLAAAKTKTISAPSLRMLGLRFVPPADRFFVEPKAQEVASQSAEAPA